MVNLPNEIINLILSFREVNPTSKIINESIDLYKKNIYIDNYISHAFFVYRDNIQFRGYVKLKNLKSIWPESLRFFYEIQRDLKKLTDNSIALDRRICCLENKMNYLNGRIDRIIENL